LRCRAARTSAARRSASCAAARRPALVSTKYLRRGSTSFGPDTGATAFVSEAAEVLIHRSVVDQAAVGWSSMSWPIMREGRCEGQQYVEYQVRRTSMRRRPHRRLRQNDRAEVG
jgi:hypothetical protein